MHCYSTRATGRMPIVSYRRFQEEPLWQIVKMEVLMIDRCVAARTIETRAKIPESNSIECSVV